MRDAVTFSHSWQPQGYWFFGDPHIDAHDHARELFVRDHDEMVERGDRGIVMGDVGSHILPTDRKRYTEGRNGRQRDALLNEWVSMAVERYRPYVNHIDLFLLGNHETSVLKHHHVDPLALLIDRLNQLRAPSLDPIVHGGYRCWVRVQFADDNRHRCSNDLWLHHGGGGGAPVTKGMIDANRIYASHHADMYVIGHKHTHIEDDSTYEQLNNNGYIERLPREFFVVAGYSGIGSYSDDYQDGYTLDYAEEKHYGPVAQGSVRVEFRPTRTNTDGSTVERVIERRRSLVS